MERLDTICRRQLQKAEALLAARQPGEARKEYAKVLGMAWAEDLHKGVAVLGIGDCLSSMKTYAEARTQYAEVLTMPGVQWPVRGRAQMGIARSFEAEGKTLEAKQAFKKLTTMKNVSRFDVAEARERLK